MPGKKPGGSEQLKRRLREDNDMDAEKKETRIAIIAIVVENPESVGEMNRILHNWNYIHRCMPHVRGDEPPLIP